MGYESVKNYAKDGRLFRSMGVMGGILIVVVLF